METNFTINALENVKNISILFKANRINLMKIFKIFEIAYAMMAERKLKVNLRALLQLHKTGLVQKNTKSVSA